MSDDQKPRRYHDLGGIPGGPIEISDHVLLPWEKRVDIMRGLLGDKKRRIMRADVMRHTIETMGEDNYKSLTYYELWMEAVRRVVVEAGIVSEDEIEARIAEVRQRLGLGEGS
jgi:hypothetical protein